MITEKTLKSWLIGHFIITTGVVNDLDMAKAKEAVKFAEEVIAFLKESNIVKFNPS